MPCRAAGPRSSSVLAAPRAARPSAASTCARPTRSSSTRPRRWCWCATGSGPCSPWPTTTRASSRSSPGGAGARPCSSASRSTSASRALVEHLDAYSAPRLVEYFDADPCDAVPDGHGGMRRPTAGAARSRRATAGARAKSLGVTIEAQYTVGEYDILILSREGVRRPGDLAARERLQIPPAAARGRSAAVHQAGHEVLRGQGEPEGAGEAGFTYLRPLQMAYESPKFMLPIRLGMVNADGAAGAVRLRPHPQGAGGDHELPHREAAHATWTCPRFVKGEFGRSTRRCSPAGRRGGQRRGVPEYVWDMGWCDPCAARSAVRRGAAQLGVFWLDGPSGGLDGTGVRRGPMGGPVNTVLTRLHVRYDGAHFPEDLVFQETSDRPNFQGRYVLQHPVQGRLGLQRDGRATGSVRGTGGARRPRPWLR